MRTYRVFNQVDTVPVEWTAFGMRWRVPSRGALIGALGVGIVIGRGVNPWIGVALWLLLSAVIVYVNLQINRMDPLGRLREGTQVSLLWRTMRHPIVSNGGTFAYDPQAMVTNERKRI